MDETALANALAALSDTDPAVARALDRVGMPAPRRRDPGFPTLLSIIVSQQLSTAVARAIGERLRTLLPAIEPAAVLAAAPETLRAAGLSARKVEYARGLAAAVVEDRLDLAGLATMDDEAAIATLSALRGFGRWSAEIYLMFALGRPDIFPADDLALRVALARLKGLAERPAAAEARTLTAGWAPWRSAGALFLWHYYSAAPA